jgi:hypothetical protein
VPATINRRVEYARALRQWMAGEVVRERAMTINAPAFPVGDFKQLDGERAANESDHTEEYELDNAAAPKQIFERKSETEENYEEDAPQIRAPQCCVCLEFNASVCLIPCGHICLCVRDIKHVMQQRPRPKCPTCMKAITQHVRVFGLN